MLRKYWNNTMIIGKIQAFVQNVIGYAFLLIFSQLYLNKKSIGLQIK